MSNWNWNCCSITCYGCVGWLGPDQSSSSRAPSWLSTGLVVTRGLLVSIRSFNKFSPVTNISSSKFAVFRVKFDPWVHACICRTKNFSPIICPSLSERALSFCISLILQHLSYLLSVSVRVISFFLYLLNSPSSLLITSLASSPLRFPILLCILLFSV